MKLKKRVFLLAFITSYLAELEKISILGEFEQEVVQKVVGV